MRLGEMRTLTWENVSLQRVQLTVRGKRGRRSIPINLTARQALEALYRGVGMLPVMPTSA
jgi:integrase